MAEYITIDVYCKGCKKKIDQPSQADMELFRLGIPVHNIAVDPTCLDIVEEKYRDSVSDTNFEEMED